MSPSAQEPKRAGKIKYNCELTGAGSFGYRTLVRSNEEKNRRVKIATEMAKNVAASASATQVQPSQLLHKAQLIVTKMRELFARIHRLEDKVQAQQAQLVDLHAKIDRLESTRAKAREHLERIASQLPQK